MFMQRMVCVGVVMAAWTGCQPNEPEMTSVTFAQHGDDGNCPDLQECSRDNGTGIYYQEDGFAGIENLAFMITHFINVNGAVQFDGRYRDPVSQNWVRMSKPGTVVNAVYNGVQYHVSHVTESDTLPIWTLTPSVGRSFQVSGDNMAELRLLLQFDPSVLGSAYTFWLMFKTSNDQQRDSGTPSTIHTYQTQWSLWTTNAWSDYCLDAHGQPDGLVFQRGIGVDPLTGQITHDSSFVTVSCFFGAPATVHKWGYDYLDWSEDATFYYGGAIQMKRDAYCGDATPHTKLGKSIAIRDAVGIKQEPLTADKVEAFWRPEGAWCLNPANRRLLDDNFDGRCLDKATQTMRMLPTCPDPDHPGTVAGNRWLADGQKQQP
jgi:hypothetical protein